MQQKKITVIHVDDDPGFIRQFKRMLEQFPEFEHLASFPSAADTLEYLQHEEPDIIFLDIEMPVHDGIWLAKKIAAKKSKIVFITSHAKYALLAFELCALDYLQKPVSAKRLKSLIEKLQQQAYSVAEADREEQLEAVSKYLDPKEKPDRIFLSTVGRIAVIRLNTVVYFNSMSNYTSVMLQTGEKLTASKTIKTFEDALAHHSGFMRISRSFIINKDMVRNIQRNGKTRQITFTMDNKEVLETSFKTKEEAIGKLQE